MHIVGQMIEGERGVVLDVGCGLACLEEILVECEYVGLDIKRHGLAPRSFVECDLNGERKLPFPSETFDIVVCTEVLEHLFYPDEIAKEIKRVLKPLGSGIIGLPNEFAIYHRLFILFGRNVMAESGHHWMFDCGRAREFVRKNFRILKEERIPPVQLRFTKPLAEICPRLFARWIFFKVKK